MIPLNLSPLEQEILEHSTNTAITKRRIWSVVIAGSIAVGALVFATFVIRSIVFVFAVSALYIVVTILEKVAYGNAVIGYKCLIQKLCQRIEELEAGNGAPGGSPSPGANVPGSPG